MENTYKSGLIDEIPYSKDHETLAAKTKRKLSDVYKESQRSDIESVKKGTRTGAVRESGMAQKGIILEKAFLFIKQYWLPTLLLLPAVVLLWMFFIYPTFNMFFSSFQKINLFKKTSEFIGFENYIQIFKDNIFLKSLRNTIIYVISVTVILVPLSFLVSLLVDCCSRMGSFVRGVLYLPSIIAMSIAALMWKLILDADIGIISRVVTGLGITMPNLLGDARYTLMTVIGLGIWRSLGSNTILFIASLKSMPREQLEAAEVDGATPLQSILHVILPNIRYVTAFVAITTIIGCFQVFTTIQVFTQGGPNNATNMLVYQIWQEGFRFFNMGKASAISSLMFIVLLGLAVIMIRVLNKQEES